MKTKITAGHRSFCRLINETPELLSVLYDFNLLPEQVINTPRFEKMIVFVTGYVIGAEQERAALGVNDKKYTKLLKRPLLKKR